MTPYRDITDEEWQRVAPLLPELRPRSELRGRPLANTRSVLNGVLWVIYSGATWSAMPRKYPSYQTCHRRFKSWHQAGVLQRVMDGSARRATGCAARWKPACARTRQMVLPPQTMPRIRRRLPRRCTRRRPVRTRRR